MDCRKALNSAKCNCTWEPCSRKGVCCECVAYHRAMDELPACYFPATVEAGYDRSIRNFIRVHKGG